MSVNIRYPNITGVAAIDQIEQIKSYLHQLVEQLNWALSTLDEVPNGNSGRVDSATVSELKSLLVMASEAVNGCYESVNRKLKGYVTNAVFSQHESDMLAKLDSLGNQYVSQADYQTYKQEVTQRITGLQQSIDELRQSIESMQEIGGE